MKPLLSKIRTKRGAAVVLAVVIFLVLIITLINSSLLNREYEKVVSGGATLTPAVTATKSIPFDGAVDVTSQVEVAKYSDVAFVVQALEVAKVTNEYNLPVSNWKVNCLLPLKGVDRCDSLNAVAQQGAIVEGVQTSFSNDRLLVAGHYYVLATKRDPAGGRLIVIPVGGATPISRQDAEAIAANGTPSDAVQDLIKLYR